MNKGNYFLPPGSWIQTSSAYTVKFVTQNYGSIDITDQSGSIIIALKDGKLTIEPSGGSPNGYLPQISSALKNEIGTAYFVVLEAALDSGNSNYNNVNYILGCLSSIYPSLTNAKGQLTPF